MLEPVVCHGKLRCAFCVQLINGNSYFEAAFFQHMIQIIEASFFCICLVSGFLYLAGISGHCHEKAVIYVLNELSCFFGDLGCRDPDPFQIGADFFQDPLVCFQCAGTLFGKFIAFTQVSCTNAFFKKAAYRAMADSAGIGDQRHAASFFAYFCQFCQIANLQHGWMEQSFSVFFFHKHPPTRYVHPAPGCSTPWGSLLLWQMPPGRFLL